MTILLYSVLEVCSQSANVAEIGSKIKGATRQLRIMNFANPKLILQYK